MIFVIYVIYVIYGIYIQVPGQTTTYALLDVSGAQSARDALAKFVYAKLFDWLVQRVNKSMGAENTTGGVNP